VRIALLLLGLCATLAVTGLQAGWAEAKPAQEYIARADPRLCPSPLCGGYWVALANHRRTRCVDGVYRSRCYVASAWPASRAIEDGALVRGGIAAEEHPGFGRLGILIATKVRNPEGAAASGAYYRLRDSGIRCVREPCFSIRASRLNTSSTALLSGVDLEPAGLELEGDIAIALTGEGLFAAGRLVSTNDGGRVLRATRVYLTGAKPRA
jgi:hypothetical protein